MNLESRACLRRRYGSGVVAVIALEEGFEKEEAEEA
jgi:hypothetical protein